MFKEMQSSLAAFSANVPSGSSGDDSADAAAASGNISLSPAKSAGEVSAQMDTAHVQRMELELNALRNEISSMERAVGGGASPSAGGLLSPGAVRDGELMQLRNEVEALKREKRTAAAADGGGGGVGEGPAAAACASCAELREEVTALQSASSEAEESLKADRAELAALKVEHATSEASKVALTKETAELKAQLEKLQQMVAEKDSEGAGAIIYRHTRCAHFSCILRVGHSLDSLFRWNLAQVRAI